MILALSIFISAFGSMGLLALQMNKAAQGFEDENGFHFVGSPDEGAANGSFRTGRNFAIERRSDGRSRSPVVLSSSLASHVR